MTLPHERTRSIVVARKLLIELIDREKYPQLPDLFRDEIIGCLRHFPTNFDINEISKTNKLLDKVLEDLEI